MLGNKFQLVEDKYLFTFQDETKLWISREFIEKYPQFPFHDIIEHSDKYDDDSYYVDMPSLSMKKVINFLMDDNIDISSLSLNDGVDIYKTLDEYHVVFDHIKQNVLLLHIKKLFYDYLKENKYFVFDKFALLNSHEMLFYSDQQIINLNGLMTPQRKEELLRYSFLFKMSNIANLKITYQYAPNIPSEYIYPSLVTNYLKGDTLLNPNTDEYIHEYINFCENNGNRIDDDEKFDYYTESEMDEYNKNNSFDIKNTNVDWHIKYSYSDRKTENKLPKLYEAILEPAVYSDDYTQVKISQDIYYSLKDSVAINYGNKISYIDKQFAIIFMKAFEEGYFDSLTSIAIRWITEFNKLISNDEFINIMTTHVFPNVTELIVDDKTFTLSLIKKECFPKLHILTYKESRLILNQRIPKQILSEINTINVTYILYKNEEEIAIYLDDLAYNHSIHIFSSSAIIYKFPHMKEIFDRGLFTYTNSLTNYYVNDDYKEVESYYYYYQNDDETNDNNDNENNNDETQELFDTKDAFKHLFNSSILQKLADCCLSFENYICINELKRIDTLINDNTFNSIKYLTIDLPKTEKNIEIEYFSIFQNILIKIVRKASFIIFKGYIHDNMIMQLIQNGGFQNATELKIDDIQIKTFFELYTKNNFPKLKIIKISVKSSECFNNFMDTLFLYNTHVNFPSLSTIYLIEEDRNRRSFVFNPNESIRQIKDTIDLSVETIAIKQEDKSISEYEIKSFIKCIKQQQIPNLRSFDIFLSGKIPKLKEFTCGYDSTILNSSKKTINIYKQAMTYSIFIRKNHVFYKFKLF
ncbi:hypothetical protein WA158_005968 [Blastocystis sp. Blastoise]